MSVTLLSSESPIYVGITLLEFSVRMLAKYKCTTFLCVVCAHIKTFAAKFGFCKYKRPPCRLSFSESRGPIISSYK